MLENLPVFMISNLVLLPYQEVKLELNNELSKKIIDEAITNYESKILVTSSYKESFTKVSELPKCAVLTKVKSKIILPNGNYRIVICGLMRVIAYTYEMSDSFTIGTVKRTYINNENQMESEAVLRKLKSSVLEYMSLDPTASNAITNTLETVNDLDMLTDIICNYLPLDSNKKLNYMNEFDSIIRANNLIKDINVELEVLNIETKVDEELRSSFEKEQRDYLIKQKINKLSEELGLDDNKTGEIADFSNKINNLGVCDKTKNKLLGELKKYKVTSEANPDSSVIRNYLDTVINLPWDKASIDEMDLKKIKRYLDKNHYGMDNVKMRILEYIAIKKTSDKINPPILCLVGPPGTGKTTISSSIAGALNREFVKISLGGLNDATELTGHKRTYLGSSPGKIIAGIKKADTKNPVILLDEVDKIVSNYKGDPSAVLLDILDETQNKNFIDNYIEEPFDLSNIIFILTANDINQISSPLRDRLEIINISSYTEPQKVNIAKKYLIPKIVDEYNADKIKINDEDIHHIISSYTNEAGVRELERTLRKIYRYIILNGESFKTLSRIKISEILGPIKYNKRSKLKEHPGNVYTLAVNGSAGVVLPIESAIIPGNGLINVTGNASEMINETTLVAYNYMLTKLKDYGIDEKKVKSHDIHINLLNYAIKKDGSSGSLAILTSVISLFLKKIVTENTCFTGEVTLHGDITKVGGVKEKIIGAYNAGYKTIFIPEDNKGDLTLIDDEIKYKLNIICVSHYDEVFEYLFK